MSRRGKNNVQFDWKYLIVLVIVVIAGMVRGMGEPDSSHTSPTETQAYSQVSEISSVPEYSGEAYVAINGNAPYFTDIDPQMQPYEAYSALDTLGRCTVAVACIDESLMPTEDRGDISAIKPTGWHSVRYDFVDGGSLYNRCHLIGFQLTGENANERNLITGTRYMNVDGMLPFENMVADYIRETGNKVLYRVTPIYRDNELVARGVQMEAYSVEDGGEGICFNVYCYNVQPGVEIDYATGESSLAEFSCSHGSQTYILNTGSGKFHDTDCSGARDMNPDNRAEFEGCAEELIAKGYEACGSCDPEVP